MEDYWWLLLVGVGLAIVLMRPWELTWGDSAWDEDSGWSFDLFGDSDGDGGD